jgi:hypothetical protein
MTGAFFIARKKSLAAMIRIGATRRYPEKAGLLGVFNGFLRRDFVKPAIQLLSQLIHACFFSEEKVQPAHRR